VARESFIKQGHLFYQNTQNKLSARGDSRSPELIFSEGFRTLNSTYHGFIEKVNEIFDVYIPIRYEKYEIQIKTALDALKKGVLSNISRDDFLVNLDAVSKEAVIKFINEEMITDFYIDDNEFKSRIENFEDFVKIIRHRIIEPYCTFDWRGAMDPSNSISVTPHMDVATIFPENNRQNTLIYFVKAATGFSLSEYLKTTEHQYLFAEEVAVRDIPPGDVIAAVKICRYYADAVNHHYCIDGDILWNPILSNQHSPQFMFHQERIRAMVAVRKGVYIETPISGSCIPKSPLEFITVTQSTHEEIAKYNNLVSLVFKFTALSEIDKCNAHAAKLIGIAKQLIDINATMPGKEVSFVEFMKNFNKFIKYPILKKCYEGVREELEKANGQSVSIYP